MWSWLTVGLVVIVVSWFGLSSGVLDRDRTSQRPAVQTLAPHAVPTGTRSGDPADAPPATPATRVPPAGVGAVTAPLSTPPRVPRGRGSYRFLAKQADGVRPVAYDPCRPIHFVVRSKGAPAGGRTVILQAIGQISKATGLTFVDDGVTRERPSDTRRAYQPRRYPGRWAPVLIAWETPSENPDFASDVAGEAGSIPVSVPGKDDVYVTGQVQLDETKIGRWLDQGGTTVARTLIMHELGHLVGLDHVRDRTQVMYPQVSAKVSKLGLGDRRGLAALGRGSCAPYL